MKLGLEIRGCIGSGIWIPGRSGAVRVMSFEVFSISTKIHVFVIGTGPPIIETVSPGVVIDRSKAIYDRLGGNEMLTSSGIPVMRVVVPSVVP